MPDIWRPSKSGRATTLLRTGASESLSTLADREDAYAAGRAAARSEFEADRASLVLLIDAVGKMEGPSLVELEAAMTQIAARIAIAVAGEAVVDRELLRERAHAAATLMCDLGEPTVLLNPGDLALFDGHPFAWPVKADPSVARGSVRATVGDAWAADGVSEAIDRVCKGIGL